MGSWTILGNLASSSSHPQGAGFVWFPKALQTESTNPNSVLLPVEFPVNSNNGLSVFRSAKPGLAVYLCDKSLPVRYSSSTEDMPTNTTFELRLRK